MKQQQEEEREQEYVQEERYLEIKEKYKTMVQHNKQLISQLKGYETNLKNFFEFFLDFYKGILELPQKFSINKPNFNFSFEQPEKREITKEEYIKMQLLDFFDANKDLLIDLHLEDKLIQVIDVLQSQQQMKRQQEQYNPT